MKFTIFFWIIIMTPVLTCSQLVISDGSENYYSQPNISESYSVYKTLRSIESRDTISINKGIIKKIEFYKGLLRKATSFSGKNNYRCIEYFYKDTNIIKCFVKYSNKKSKEIYYFDYDNSTNSLIKEVGYEGNKIIFKKITKKSNDTLITNTFYNHFYIISREHEYKIFSKDSLEELSVLKLDHQANLRFLKKKYNVNRQIVLEVDSAKDEYEQKIYFYDSIGRIKKIQSKDTVLRSLKEFRYHQAETIISTFGVYHNIQQEQHLRELEILKYDNSGILVYNEINKYQKGESSLDDSSTATEVVQKYYENSKLQRVLVTFENHIQYLYSFKYH